MSLSRCATRSRGRCARRCPTSTAWRRYASPPRRSSAEKSPEKCADQSETAPSSRGAGTNCIKIGLPGKSILRDYFQENMTSRRPFLLLRLNFPGIPIFNQLPPDQTGSAPQSPRRFVWSERGRSSGRSACQRPDKSAGMNDFVLQSFVPQSL